MARPVGGVLRDGEVVVEDGAEAERLEGRGGFGERVGKVLRLTVAEAAWCVEQGWLAVTSAGRPVALGDLLAAGKDGRTEVDILAYRDLRERGLLVRPGTGAGAFDVWPRGGSLKDRPAYAVHAAAERSALDMAALAAWAESKEVVALVDEDGEVTHYRASVAAPTGGSPPGDLPRSAGTLLQDRVLVADGKAAEAFHDGEGLGTRHGTGLLLSLLEAEVLRRRGVLEVPPGLGRRAEEQQAGFRTLLAAYESLRAAGVVVKSGLKFGTHLRGYSGHPDKGHAEWLVHATDGAGLHWSDVGRGVRLAHGVRKAFLLAWVRPGGVRFVEVAWFKA
ncbi:MAG TPA: hypothetical protein VI796_05910 [Candidatus Thermoplasmatota archaeon]|nr:hypothetical protein [Candidatus Thermoplasmatota archaeon]